MTDFFVLFQEPRRPWIDPESIKSKFLELSSRVHPDRVHNAAEEEKRAAQERYTELNSAHNCLRDPKERLRHLLELERGSKPSDLQQVPGDLMNMFMEVSRACRETDAFLAQKEKVQSPLLKVQLFEQSQAFIEKLRAIQGTLNPWHEKLIADLKSLDAQWIEPGSNRAALLDPLEALYRLLSYYNRWNAQIQERIARLSF
jgi:DnaJ-domain-containing protein 1